MEPQSGSLYDYHLALAFDFEEGDGLVWVAEMVRSPRDDVIEWKGKSEAGLPGGLFSNQKSRIWVNFGGTFECGKCLYIL
jgi:hypothetical protein